MTTNWPSSSGSASDSSFPPMPTKSKAGARARDAGVATAAKSRAKASPPHITVLTQVSQVPTNAAVKEEVNDKIGAADPPMVPSLDRLDAHVQAASDSFGDASNVVQALAALSKDLADEAEDELERPEVVEMFLEFVRHFTARMKSVQENICLHACELPLAIMSQMHERSLRPGKELHHRLRQRCHKIDSML